MICYIAIHQSKNISDDDYNLAFESHKMKGELSALNWYIQDYNYVFYEEKMLQTYIGKMLRDCLTLTTDQQHHTTISISENHIGKASILKHVKMRWPDVAIGSGANHMEGPGADIIKQAIQNETVDWVLYDLQHR